MEKGIGRAPSFCYGLIGVVGCAARRGEGLWCILASSLAQGCGVFLHTALGYAPQAWIKTIRRGDCYFEDREENNETP